MATMWEIDIIEQFSNKQVNMSTAHWYSNGNAQYGLSVNNSTLTSSFNTFRLDWTPTSITAYLNDSQYWVMSTNATMPFFDNFFLIANLALGGNKGAGNIDPNFTEDSLEIDYIRVYQNSSGSVLSSEIINGNQNIINYYKSYGEWYFKSTMDVINDIFIYDISGKLIQKHHVEGKMAKINSKNIQNGLHFIQLSGNFGIQTIKILNKN